MLEGIASKITQDVTREPGESGNPADFSIVLGGPLCQLLRRAHVSGDALELVRRRMAIITAVAWLPLLVLALVGDRAFGNGVAVPFLKDIEVHARFLVALPLLIVAELVVHVRMRTIASEFVVRGLVTPETIERFRDAVRSAFRLRNSVAAEVAMVAIIYALGVPLLWREAAALDVPTWYADASKGSTGLTAAGIWFVYVSVPLFQFLLLRWYFRLVVWLRFLWQVSRIPLDISAMHADRMAGFGFLAGTAFAFVPLAMAHGALLAGVIANRIFYVGAPLTDSKMEVALVVAFLLLLVFGPLTVFAQQASLAKRTATRVYGRLAQRYVSDFEHTWLPGGLPAEASPLGSGDIQSLADLSNSLETVRATRLVPITRQAVMTLVVATLVPVAPLLLTVIPAEELARRLLKLVM
jgi:hypothetical protein